VQAEQEACTCEEDLAQGMIERVMGLINPGAIRAGIKPLAETILRKLASPRAGKILDAEYGKALKDYLLQGTQMLGEVKPSALLAGKPQNRMNIVEILLSATNIQQYQKNRLMLKYEPPDVLIEPDVVDILALEFTKSAGAIEEGRIKTLEAVPQILALVSKRGRATSR
jgi:predicted acylesterase/phospholipase RssA